MLLPFFEWCEATALGQLVRNSLWLFPVIESIHLLGLSLLGGAVLLVDLRMLGLGLKGRSISELARDTRPWLGAGVGTMAVTGTLLFLSEAVKCYHNPSFWVKVTTLPIALLFCYAIRERVARSAGGSPTVATRLAALGSLALWFTVAAAGRWIGFSS